MSRTSVDGLAPMDRLARIDRLRAAFDGHQIDAMLVTKGANLRWLVGFTGSAGTALVTGDRLVVVTDGRYREQASHELAVAGVDAEIIISTAPSSTFARLGWVPGGARLGVEADHLVWSLARSVDQDWFPDAAVVPTSGVVEELRAIKEVAEVARIESAAGIADEALAEAIPLLVAGTSETEIAIALEAAMRHRGAEEPAFDTIVASGPNAALPHHHPGPRRLKRGDLVVIDMGATVDGYRSDMTRTFVIGSPDATAQRLLDVVGEAQAAGVAAVADGMLAADADAAARQVIAAAGWADQFVHPTGHGVGLEIHEPLRLAPTSDATLAAGHVVTVEPGVYLPGIGGVRIEDTVEVTTDGCRRLTRSSLPAVVG